MAMPQMERRAGHLMETLEIDSMTRAQWLWMRASVALVAAAAAAMRRAENTQPAPPRSEPDR